MLFDFATITDDQVSLAFREAWRRFHAEWGRPLEQRFMQGPQNGFYARDVLLACTDEAARRNLDPMPGIDLDHVRPHAERLVKHETYRYSHWLFQQRRGWGGRDNVERYDHLNYVPTWLKQAGFKNAAIRPHSMRGDWVQRADVIANALWEARQDLSDSLMLPLSAGIKERREHYVEYGRIPRTIDLSEPYPIFQSMAQYREVLEQGLRLSRYSHDKQEKWELGCLANGIPPYACFPTLTPEQAQIHLQHVQQLDALHQAIEVCQSASTYKAYEVRHLFKESGLSEELIAPLMTARDYTDARGHHENDWQMHVFEPLVKLKLKLQPLLDEVRRAIEKPPEQLDDALPADLSGEHDYKPLKVSESMRKCMGDEYNLKMVVGTICYHYETLSTIQNAECRASIQQIFTELEKIARSGTADFPALCQRLESLAILPPDEIPVEPHSTSADLRTYLFSFAASKLPGLPAAAPDESPLKRMMQTVELKQPKTLAETMRYVSVVRSLHAFWQEPSIPAYYESNALLREHYQDEPATYYHLRDKLIAACLPDLGEQVSRLLESPQRGKDPHRADLNKACGILRKLASQHLKDRLIEGSLTPEEVADTQELTGLAFTSLNKLFRGLEPAEDVLPAINEALTHFGIASSQESFIFDAAERGEAAELESLIVERALTERSLGFFKRARAALPSLTRPKPLPREQLYRPSDSDGWEL